MKLSKGKSLFFCNLGLAVGIRYLVAVEGWIIENIVLFSLNVLTFVVIGLIWVKENEKK